MFSSDAAVQSVSVWGTSVSFRAWETVEGAVIVPGSAPGEPETDKTGGLLWSAGRCLASALAWPPFVGWLANACTSSMTKETTFTLANCDRETSGLELGCGPGLASMILAQLGIPNMIVTDGSADVVALASENVKRNTKAPSQAVTAGVLNWNHPEEADPCVTPFLKGCQDIIVASDVIYPGTTQASIGNLFQLVNHALRFCDEPWPQPSTHDDLHSVAVGWFDRITRADEFAALCASGPQRLFVLSFVDRQRGLVQSLFTESMRQGFCCAELCWSAVGGVELARSADAESAPSVWRVPPACLRAEDTAPEGGRTFVFRRIPSPKDVNHACSLCARGPVEAGHNPFSSYCLGCQSVLISVAHAFGAEVYPRMYAAVVESSSDEEGDWGPACVDE